MKMISIKWWNGLNEARITTFKEATANAFMKRLDKAGLPYEIV